MRAGLGETRMHSHPGDRITSPGVQGSNLFQKSWVLTSIDSSRKKNCWPFLSLTWGLHSVAKLGNQECPFPINPAHLHYLISQHCGDSVVETWSPSTQLPTILSFIRTSVIAMQVLKYVYRGPTMSVLIALSGFPEVWTLQRWIQPVIPCKAFPHSSRLYDSSPVRILWCTVILTCG